MYKKTQLALACSLALGTPGLALAQNTTTAAPQKAETDDASRQTSEGVSAQATRPGEVQSLNRVTIVTSSKRQERLQDAPSSITALTGETMEKLGVEKFGDYMSIVPNLSQASGGTPGLGTVIMRGMYTGTQQTTNTSAVYLGETPFSASGSLSLGALVTPDPDLVDVARVEVLKGPQGTLYGASSLGGLIRIIPREPDLTTFSGNVRLGASQVDGGGSGYGARVSLNIPVSDTFGILVGAFKRKDGGFTENTRTGSDNLGRTDAEGVGITALARLNRDWKATLRVLSQNSNTVGSASQDNIQLTARPTTGEAQFAAFTDTPAKVDYRLVELSTEYDLGPGTLTATLSRAQARARLQADYTQSYGVLLARTLPAGFGVVGDLDINMKSKTTGEFRFATKRLGNFEGLAGLFYTSEDNDYGANTTAYLANGRVAPAPLNNVITSDTASTYKETALFANGTYYLTDELDLGAGLRYSRNKQDALLQSTGLLSTGVPPRNFDFSDSATTYQVTGRWRPNRDLSTFVRYSTGYRPGSPQAASVIPAGAQTSIQPDTVGNIEAGIKGTAFDRKLAFDASIYHTDWKDIQLNSLYAGRLLLANAGRAKINGLETQVQYNADNGVSFGANLGFNDAKLTQVNADTTSATGAQAGNRLPGSPRLTAALFADWRFQVTDGVTGSIGATVKHQGNKISSYPNSSLNPGFVMPAYTMLDLRAGLEWGRYTLRLRLDNATNKLGYTSYTTNRILASQVTIPSNVSLTRPRTLSLTLGVDF